MSITKPGDGPKPPPADRAPVAVQEPEKVVAPANPADDRPKPKLTFTGRSIDLGVLKPGETPFEIEVRNNGNAALIVSRVSGTANCKTPVQTLEVPPRASAMLRIFLQVDRGPHTGALAVFSNDPAARHDLRLNWTGQTGPLLASGTITLAGRPGETLEQTVAINYPSRSDNEPLSFLGANGLGDDVAVELIRDDPTAIEAIFGLSTSARWSPSAFLGQAEIRVKAVAPAKPGVRVSSGTIQVEHRGLVYPLPLTLRVEAASGLRCKPDLFLISGTSAEALRATDYKAVLTSETRGDRFEVIRKPEYLDVTVEPDPQDTARTTLAVRVMLPTPVGSSREQILLRTDSGKEISIPVLFTHEP